MKILFDSSISGRKEYEDKYKLIDKYLNETGNDVVSPVFMATPDDIKKETDEEAAKYYSDLSRWIKEADILVFEVSHPSLGIGHEIAWGLQLGKPIIVLHLKNKTPFVLEAMNDERIQIYEYDENSLKKIIVNAIEYAKDQKDTRFTMLLQSDITNYLDDVSESGKSRSEYIRELIRKEMKK